MIERLSLEVDAFEHQDHLRELSFASSPAQGIRSVFDQMRYESNDDWERAAQRLNKVPAALDGVIASLNYGLEQNAVVSRRQALACARQARVWAGTDVENTSFFEALVTQNTDTNFGRKLENKLHKEASQAAAAFDEFSSYSGQYLRAVGRRS